METERRCFSKVILESNITPNMTRSSDSFSTVPPIIHDGDCVGAATIKGIGHEVAVRIVMIII